MKRNKKIISWICILGLMVGFLPLVTRGDGLSDAPDPAQISGNTIGTQTIDPTAPSETLPQTTIPEETISEETIPGETLAEEETIPDYAEELPEETVPVTEPDTAEPYWLDIPLYFQNDYPETMFGTGSVASSGCSITCLAMVATYMTGREYLPDELARYFGGTAENNIRRLEIGSETMQLPFHKAANFHKSIEALKDGKVVIVLMNANSIFTDTQHFIVLTGINEEGLIMVNDPQASNYSKWDTKRGLVNGFESDDILKGYSGGWIYDKDAMPEEPFLYSEPERDKGNPRYPEIQLSLAEKRLLARLIWVEARGESLEGQQAVAEVVLNRMHSENFPNTLRGVIYAEGQFRSVPFLDDAEPYQAQYEAIESALYGPYVLAEDVVHFATYPVNDNVWGSIGGHIFCYGS